MKKPRKLPSYERWLKNNGIDKWYKNKVEKIVVSCNLCDGTGKRYYFEDCDPIEGYKMASKRECDKCGGVGFVHVDTYRDEYDAEVKKNEEKIKEYEYYTTMMKSIKLKLTKEEVKFLKIYGIDNKSDF